MGFADMRNIDISMLRTFDALMRERSVSRAASRLFLSQPAVSASLKRLRETFNDRLFVRTAHGVEPTPRALELSARVDAVLLELQRLLSADQAFDPATSDRILRIAGSDHASRVMLPPLCRRLTAAGSHMRLFWETADYSRLVERLNKGDIDLAVIPRMQQVTGVEAALLYEDAYVVVARHGHALHGAATAMAAFCAWPHIVLSYGRSTLDDAIDQILAREGQRRHVQSAVTSFSQMVEVLADSDQIAVFPQRVALRYADRLGCQALPFDLPNYRVSLCWDARANADAAVLWLKDEMLRLGRGDLPAI